MIRKSMGKKLPAASDAFPPASPPADKSLRKILALIWRNIYWLLAAALLFAALMMLYAETLPPTPVDQSGKHMEEFGKINSLLQSGDIIKAGRELDKIIEEHPNDASAHAARGQIHSHFGMHIPAIDELTDAIGLDPNNPGYRHERAKIYRTLGWIQKAHDDMTAVLDTYPTDKNALIMRAKDGALLGKINKVIADLDLATSLYPEDTSAYVMKIQLFEALKRPAHVLANAQILLKLGNENEKNQARQLIDKYGVQK